ncbi:MAG: hypothetical protein HYW15_00285 [Candidatus Giovannonibacteria bacterium]|nr:MAG: hypothetical protein HYW15_00285 [Candidatus Giovannonibacteria bacterium]
MEGGKEQLDPREEAKKIIDHLLDDFGEYPDIWLTNEEKTAEPEIGSELAEKKRKWSHNKYSVTWWFTPVVGYLDRIIENNVSDENQKSRFREELNDLLQRVRSEGRGAISKDTINKAEKLLQDIKASLI